MHLPETLEELRFLNAHFVNHQTALKAGAAWLLPAFRQQIVALSQHLTDLEKAQAVRNEPRRARQQQVLAALGLELGDVVRVTCPGQPSIVFRVESASVRSGLGSLGHISGVKITRNAKFHLCGQSASSFSGRRMLHECTLTQEEAKAYLFLVARIVRTSNNTRDPKEPLTQTFVSRLAPEELLRWLSPAYKAPTVPALEAILEHLKKGTLHLSEAAGAAGVRSTKGADGRLFFHALYEESHRLENALRYLECRTITQTLMVLTPGTVINVAATPADVELFRFEGLQTMSGRVYLRGKLYLPGKRRKIAYESLEVFDLAYARLIVARATSKITSSIGAKLRPTRA